MKITREFWKTLALSFLVLLSIALTWNIWFFHIDYKNYNSPSDSIKNEASIQNGVTQNLDEVVRPDLTILKPSEGGYLGQSNNETVSKIYSLFKKGKFADYFPVSNETSLPKPDKNVYELVFPTPISINVIPKIFGMSAVQFNLKDNILIDRVSVYQKKSNHKLVAVFSNGENSPVFYTNVTNINLTSLKSTLSAGNLSEYVKRKLNGKSVFLPISGSKVKAINCFNTPINYQNFVPVFFNNIDTAVRNKDTYSDGTHQLEKNGDIIQYVNPNIPDLSQAVQDPILHAFEFINNHKGWTNNYRLDSLSLSPKNSRADVSFRMTINGLPIYSTVPYPFQYLASIDISWENGQLSKLSRTLYNLTLIDTKETVLLKSGPAAINELYMNANIKQSDIQDLKIGYEISSKDTQSNPQIKLVPDWFYELGGRWYSLKSTETVNKQTGQGGSGS